MKYITKRPNQKWQVVIPKSVRDTWGVTNHNDVLISFIITNGIVQLTQEPRKSWQHLAGTLTGKAKVSKKDIDETIEEEWNREIQEDL